ncbi:hypothetical protein C1Y63_06140 [Corynebacterium sp. 13CS0277]|uniref:hypothetical protein n=1 Tax=Corynebacterium sp. 13CS0277 TaxID=2071994 RepID=UPI000D03877E|nr:hypothetical protein [Corynebacterium sp. 13CS0277]PRQ11427.1 hypothetical protein C1Y63_06140 [Corynebacterium sp. 13CS0277]
MYSLDSAQLSDGQRRRLRNLVVSSQMDGRPLAAEDIDRLIRVTLGELTQDAAIEEIRAAARAEDARIIAEEGLEGVDSPLLSDRQRRRVRELAARREAIEGRPNPRYVDSLVRQAIAYGSNGTEG